MWLYLLWSKITEVTIQKYSWEKQMLPIWLCLSWGRQFEGTQMQAMWLCIISRRPFEDTCENALWRKVQRFNQCSEWFHIVSHLTIWRSRRDVAHWLTYSLTHWTLAATWLMGLWWLKMKVVNWWKLFIDESCQLMKVVNWWKLSVDVSCLLMKVVYWWKLSIDES